MKTNYKIIIGVIAVAIFALCGCNKSEPSGIPVTDQSTFKKLTEELFKNGDVTFHTWGSGGIGTTYEAICDSQDPEVSFDLDFSGWERHMKSSDDFSSVGQGGNAGLYHYKSWESDRRVVILDVVRMTPKSYRITYHEILLK